MIKLRYFSKDAGAGSRVSEPTYLWKQSKFRVAFIQITNIRLMRTFLKRGIGEVLFRPFQRTQVPIKRIAQHGREIHFERFFPPKEIY